MKISKKKKTSQQKTQRICDCPKEDRLEAEGILGVQNYLEIEGDAFVEVYISPNDLLGNILIPSNLEKARRQVEKNKGCGGIDQMGVSELLPYLKLHQEDLVASLRTGTYFPQPVMRVQIPKGDGRMRNLGIPTVVDRWIQQAIAQVLARIYEPQFRDHSYGFRPKRNAHQALIQAEKWASQGYTWVVDFDLEKFFDTVCHSKLIEVLSRTIKDGMVVSLIHKYLNAGVMRELEFEPTKEGVPQGGPLSPLLSNILLNELDKELEKRGHKFVRYADDFIIMVKSKRAAERVFKSVTKFIEKKLYLKVNKEKTMVCKVTELKFLGFSMYKKSKTEYRLRIHPSRLEKLRLKLKELTCRSNGKGYEWVKRKLREFINGWLPYYAIADMKSHMSKITGWLNDRIRQYFWKCWKRVRTRIAKMIELGIEKSQAIQWANTRKGYQRSAKSFLHIVLNNKYLSEEGYPNVINMYVEMHKCW